MVARELLDLGQYAKGLRDLRGGDARLGPRARRRGLPRRLDRAALPQRRARGRAPLRRGERRSPQTPLSIARAAYWQGRAAEAMGQGEEARRFYERAAQLPDRLLRPARGQASGSRRDRPARARERRRAATRARRRRASSNGSTPRASTISPTPLAEAAAERWRDEAQIAALAEVVAAHGDATTSVEFGKIATERGFALDATAFPTFGVPRFAPLPHSADLPSVYAVARQESEFAWRAASGAGAKGLMQILPSTAQSTARRAGVAFDPSRLSADPAFNTAARRGVSRPIDRGRGRLAGTRLGRLQRGRRPRRAMARRLRRSAHGQNRSGRLGRAHPLRRDARLRAARERKPRRLSRAARRARARRRKQPRMARE